MPRLRSLTFLVPLIIHAPWGLSGQELGLTPGEPVVRELGPGQAHVFAVSLESGQFVLGQADQRGVDVVVTILDPAGGRVDRVDVSARGPDRFSFVTGAAGDYRVEVTPYLDDETGEYALLVERVEPVAATPSGRVDQLFAAWDRPGSPGASVAIARDGEILYEAGYGYAQLEYGVPITPSTIFHVASVSKQFTAFAVAMLAVQGRLSLDDDIREHIPELPDFGHTITIRHLVHHTSGLRDQWNLLALAGWRLDDVITLDQVMRLITRQRELNFVPGDEYLYCNTGFTLLGEIVARATGQSFREWTAETIFRPLGMNRTHFHDDHEMIVPDRAYSYANGPDGYRKSVLSYANAGATSLFTTVGDLSRWMHNLETGVVGGPRVLDLVHTRGILNNGDTIGYAFGLGHGTFRGLHTVGHSGGDAGFRSYAVRFPEQGLSIAVLSNAASFNPGGMARRVAEAYLEGVLEPEPTDQGEEGPAAEEEPATFDADAVDLLQYTGVFDSPELETTYELVADEGFLIARHVRHDPITLTPAAPDEFRGSAWFFRSVRFERDGGGAVTDMRVSSGRVRNVLFVKRGDARVGR